MKELNAFMKIAYIHAERIKMALNELQPLHPFNATDIIIFKKETLLLTDLLVHRFGKLQDLLGDKIINEFLILLDEYESSLSMLDKIHKLERLEIIEDAELWKEMRNVRNHVTHEYPDHPDFTALDLNTIVTLAPELLKILDNIQNRINYTTQHD